jgi:hypothetical protein
MLPKPTITRRPGRVACLASVIDIAVREKGPRDLGSGLIVVKMA